MRANVPLYQVDAFADRAFAGNPAAVCLLDGPADPAWMQQVGREMNLSETAFVHPENDGFHLRWFTPAVEVELCGHATLATAHTLWETGRLERAAAAKFYTKSGLLTATWQDGWIELDFPAIPTREIAPPEGLLEALGARATGVAESRFDLLVGIATADEVRAMAPDFGALGRVPARGVCVTAPADEPAVDFVSRFFAPAVGIDEDPVTGSAHSMLAPYWQAKLGKDVFLAHQVSARGGVLRLRVAGDRVKIAGQAVTVVKGALLA